jgi:hypothetical protein
VQERAGSARVEAIVAGDDGLLGWRVSPGSRR